MDAGRKGTQRLKEGLETVVGEARTAGEAVVRLSEGVLAKRKNVVMVRLNQESLGRIDELVDAGLVSSRSESAAFLIHEGIEAKSDLFKLIADKLQEIRQAREDLRGLIQETSAEESAPSG